MGNAVVEVVVVVVHGVVFGVREVFVELYALLLFLLLPPIL